MATAFNTTVKLYAGVPLVKGGTDVLYQNAATAEGTLASKLVATYSAYYFERENRRYIQIDDIFGNIDSVNYISFANMSHGGKIYFGFVDQVVYINDHNTQIEFTIDPFPTYLGDTDRLDEFYVVRNTPRNDLRGHNLEPDYIPEGAKNAYTVLSEVSYPCTYAWALYASKNHVNSVGELSNNGIGLGIYGGPLSSVNLKDILDDGGIIAGIYLFPSCITGWEIIQPISDVLTGDPLAHLSSYTHEKIRTGVYAQVVLRTPNGTKTYELEEFSNVHSITFKLVGVMLPAPSIIVYPMDYRGITDNVAEGISIAAPSLPLAAAGGYSDRQLSSDIFSALGAAISGAVSGAAIGGAYGAIGGAAAGLLGGVANIGKNAYLSKFNAPQTFQGGNALIAADRALKISLAVVNPSQMDLNRVDAYFDYYGYNVNHMVTKTQAQFGQLDMTDNAFLQTGTPFVVGSEGDREINARIMAGIKIRHDLNFSS